MPTGQDSFDLNATLAVIWHAFSVIVCTIGFQTAVHGFIVACVIGCLGLISLKQGKRTAKPLLAVFRKLAIFCGCLAIPGAICLITTHSLPPVGQLQLNSIGLFCFWALVVAHLCMEEMNYQWFPAEKQP